MPTATPTLGVAVAGEDGGPAVLFLHGFMGSKSDWTDAMDGLTQGFGCAAVDLPGHGTSLGLPDGAYVTEGAARGVLLALDRLEMPRATLVGYSMGGRLALYLALRYPERCSALFLESASPGLGTAGERARRRTADEAKARRLEGGDFGTFLRDWYRQPLFAPLARHGSLLRRTVEARLKNDPRELAKSLRGMGTGSQPSLWEELPDLRVPALVVVGELDEKFVGVSRRMENLSGRLRAAVVPEVGHNVRLEAPKKYLALLRDFLEDPSTRSMG